MESSPVRIPPDAIWRLTDQLGHANAHLMGVTRDALQHLDISVGEFVALTILVEFPDGLTQTTWGRLQGVTRQRAHTVSKRLASLGLVNVQREGRSSTVTASLPGVALVQRERPALIEAAGANLGTLTAEDAAQLSALLAKLLADQPRGTSG